jgi:hypothetical protein
MGFLPFAPSYSMATAVKNLVSSKNYSIDVLFCLSWKWRIGFGELVG